MDQLISFFEQKIQLSEKEIALLEQVFAYVEFPKKSIIIQEGKTESYLYFVVEGILKGYKNKNGKIIVEHLVGNTTFFTALDSFMNGTPSEDCFESITDCKLYRISKTNFELLKQSDTKWNQLAEAIINESLRCKMERVHDFQTLTAKERYLKFIKQTPQLALQVSVENIASFLGIEPQSLSRIRKQITF